MRKVADCRDMPSANNCTLVIAGEEEHVLDAAVAHAVKSHGHEDTPELRAQIRGSLKDEKEVYPSGPMPPRPSAQAPQSQPTAPH